MERAKYKIVWFWLTHLGFLRRMGKRYPEWFETVFIPDLTDNPTARKIMVLRYVGPNPKRFKVIAAELGIEERNVFAHHKKVLDALIYGKN